MGKRRVAKLVLGRGEVGDNERVLCGEGRWRMTKICRRGEEGEGGASAEKTGGQKG